MSLPEISECTEHTFYVKYLSFLLHSEAKISLFWWWKAIESKKWPEATHVSWKCKWPISTVWGRWEVQHSHVNLPVLWALCKDLYTLVWICIHAYIVVKAVCNICRQSQMVATVMQRMFFRSLWSIFPPFFQVTSLSTLYLPFGFICEWHLIRVHDSCIISSLCTCNGNIIPMVIMCTNKEEWNNTSLESKSDLYDFTRTCITIKHRKTFLKNVKDSPAKNHRY